MIVLRFILLLFVFVNLNAKEAKIKPSFEVGMHFSDYYGTVANKNSISDFRDNFGYNEQTMASYFAFDLKLDYDYIPNFKVSYFYNKQYKDANLTQKIYIADGVFDTNNSVVSCVINYQVMNFTLYQNFKAKGNRIKFLRFKFYPGDIEFYVGLNLKVINWKFQVTDDISSQTYKHWIDVNENIPLPYIGFKYYYYNFRAYGGISALSFVEAKSTNYEFGIDYRLINRLFLNASYMYEDFKATESTSNHIDTVSFRAIGNKVGFKYVF